MIQEKALQLINARVILFWGLLIALLGNFLLYTYFLNATILHIVERKSVERDISEVTIHISELETQYMAKSAEVTPVLAQSLGFVEPEGIVFVQEGQHAGFATLGE